MHEGLNTTWNLNIHRSNEDVFDFPLWTQTFVSSPDQLLQPWCVSAGSVESIPPQRLHGSRAMQPDLVWFSRSMPAQKPRQQCLLAPGPPLPQHLQAGRQADSHRWARWSGEEEFSDGVPVPVLQRLSGSRLQSDRPGSPKKHGSWNCSLSSAVCRLAHHLYSPLTVTQHASIRVGRRFIFNCVE